MKRFLVAIIVAVIGFCSFDYSPLSAGQYTYQVQAGDTLWDICEKVYGDADLWPKLWQMNPFITNPHLLKPGDTITLLDAPRKGESKVADFKPVDPVTTEGMVSGLDASAVTNVQSLGFLSREWVNPWGQIVSGEGDRVMLAEGDVAFLQMEEGFQTDPGKVYTIFSSSSPLEDPLDGSYLGYVITFLGKILVKEEVREGLYKGEIIDSYRTIRPGDTLLPDEPISSCVRLIPSDPALLTHIAAVKDELNLVGQFATVYLPVGYGEGVRKGNIFQIEVKSGGTKGEYVFLPDRVVGHLLVIESRPDTSTAVVLAVEEDISNGAALRGVSWVQAPDFLPAFQACRIE